MLFQRNAFSFRDYLSHLLLSGIFFAALLTALFSVSRPAVAHAAVALPARVATIVEAPSANFTAAHNRIIDTVVIHFSSAISVDPAHWADPARVMQIFRQSHVSAHYLIDRSGTIYRLVPEQDIAWHAGGSIMPAPDNRRNVNRFSLGIELIATRTSGYTEAQYASLTTLLHGIKGRYPIRHIVGHDEISGPRAVHMGLRADLKEDPGPLFEWSRVR